MLPRSGPEIRHSRLAVCPFGASWRLRVANKLTDAGYQRLLQLITERTTTQLGVANISTCVVGVMCSIRRGFCTLVLFIRTASSIPLRACRVH